VIRHVEAIASFTGCFGPCAIEYDVIGIAWNRVNRLPFPHIRFTLHALTLLQKRSSTILLV
jgi:hypothetical protein